MSRLGDLPLTARSSDLVRLKEEWRRKYVEDSDRGGLPAFDPEATRKVVRSDRFGTQGARLFVEGSPFALYSQHVEIAWPNGKQCEERRKALKEAGWTP